MTYPTNKITNDQIDKIVIQNRVPSNSLSISIPYTYVAALVHLNWHDMLFALNNGYFLTCAAVEHAMVELDCDKCVSQTVVDLACMSMEEAQYEDCFINSAVAMLAEKVEGSNEKAAKEKLLYVLLKILYETRTSFADPFYVLEIIYDDFNFPIEIAEFIRYMPNQREYQNLRKLSEEELLKRWSNYLEKERSLYYPKSEPMPQHIHYCINSVSQDSKIKIYSAS